LPRSPRSRHPTTLRTGLDCSSSLMWVKEEMTRERISRSIDVLDDTIREIRNTISVSRNRLRRSSFASGTLADRRRFERGIGFSPTLEIIGSRMKPARSARSTRARVCPRSALQCWSSRHAQSVLVCLNVDLETVHLKVVDDGVGIGSPERSSGLKNLRERASLFQGSLTLSNMPKAYQS